MSTHAAHAAAAMERAERLLDATSLGHPIAKPAPALPEDGDRDLRFELLVLFAQLGLAISRSTAGVKVRYRERADGIADRLGTLVETIDLDDDSDVAGFAVNATLTLSDAVSWLQTRRGCAHLCARAMRMRQRLTQRGATQSQPRPTGSAGRG